MVTFENHSIKDLLPYKISSHKAWEKKNAKDILKLDWNESTDQLPDIIKKKLILAIDSSRLNWYPNIRNRNLIAAISRYNEIPIDNIQYFASSDSLHEYIVRAFTNKDDKVLIVGPTYDNFRVVCESFGVKIEFFSLIINAKDPDGALDIMIAKEEPSLIYICNPNNPTGFGWDIDYIEKLINKYKNTLFIVDEAYFEFYGKSSKMLVLNHANIIITRTFSKAFGLASFRIGYAIANSTLINALNKIRNPKNISTLSQVAAETELNNIKYMHDYVEEITCSKSEFVQFLTSRRFTYYNENGNFILINLNNVSSTDFTQYLESYNIFIRDYSHVNGLENHVRITIGRIGEMRRVMQSIDEYLLNGKQI